MTPGPDVLTIVARPIRLRDPAASDAAVSVGGKRRDGREKVKREKGRKG